MLSENEILEEGENLLGRYHVEINRRSGDRWVSTVPPLYALTTDRRMVLQPQTRKKYEPASLPGGAIKDVNIVKARRSLACVTLKNDYRITLTISWGNISEFIDQIRMIAELPPQREYDAPLSSENLNRLIEFLESLS